MVAACACKRSARPACRSWIAAGWTGALRWRCRACQILPSWLLRQAAALTAWLQVLLAGWPPSPCRCACSMQTICAGPAVLSCGGDASLCKANPAVLDVQAVTQAGCAWPHSSCVWREAGHVPRMSRPTPPFVLQTGASPLKSKQSLTSAGSLSGKLAMLAIPEDEAPASGANPAAAQSPQGLRRAAPGGTSGLIEARHGSPGTAAHLGACHTQCAAATRPARLYTPSWATHTSCSGGTGRMSVWLKPRACRCGRHQR